MFLSLFLNKSSNDKSNEGLWQEKMPLFLCKVYGWSITGLEENNDTLEYHNSVFCHIVLILKNMQRFVEVVQFCVQNVPKPPQMLRYQFCNLPSAI